MNTRHTLDESFDSYKEFFLSEGHCLISDQHQFLTVDQWKTLNHEASKLDYKTVSCPLDESAPSFRVSPIKLSGAHHIANKPIFDVISSVQSRKLISALVGSSHFMIDSSACHLCEEGEAIVHSWSKRNFKEYGYVLNLFLEGSYTGGQLIVHSPDHKESMYHPQSGEIFFSSCQYLPEVNPVISGRRHHIVAFIKTIE